MIPPKVVVRGAALVCGNAKNTPKKRDVPSVSHTINQPNPQLPFWSFPRQIKLWSKPFGSRWHSSSPLPPWWSQWGFFTEPIFKFRSLWSFEALKRGGGGSNLAVRRTAVCAAAMADYYLSPLFPPSHNLGSLHSRMPAHIFGVGEPKVSN